MKERIEALKLTVQLLVYCAILGLIVSLFFKPEFTAKRTGDFFQAFQDHNINIKIAAFGFNLSPQEVEELTEESATLDEVKVNATCLETANCTEAEQAQLAALLEIENVTDYLQSEDQITVTTDDDGNEVITMVPGNAPVALPDWLVVLSADRTLGAAEDNLDVARVRLPGEDVEILRRDGWYRTVLFFDSADDAKEALPRLESATRQKGIYVRSTQIWCRGNALEESAGFISCG